MHSLEPSETPNHSASHQAPNYAFKPVAVRLRLLFQFTYVQYCTYDPLVVVGAAAVRGCHGGGALLGVPGRLLLLAGAADADGVDAARVAVTVAVVTQVPAVTRRPGIDYTLPATPLQNICYNIWLYSLMSPRCPPLPDAQA